MKETEGSVQVASNGTNDGSKNNFYSIPYWVHDLDDLAEYLDLDGFEFNTLKSLWLHRGDRHNGTNEEREINKRLHYANRSSRKYQRSKDEECNQK